MTTKPEKSVSKKASASPPNSTPVRMIGATQDAVDRRHAEEALREIDENLEQGVLGCVQEPAGSKTLLEATAKLARVGGWEVDLKTRTQTWTDMVYEIHEIGRDFKPTVENGIGFYAPEAVPVISEAFRLAAEEGRPFDVELQLITAEKNRLWVRSLGAAIRENGVIVRVGGTFQDINDRKLAEIELKTYRDHLEELVTERTAELAHSRALLVEAQAVARLGSWELNPGRDEISGSEEFYRLFGVQPLGLAHYAQFVALLHPDDRERVQRAVADALDRNLPYDTDYRVPGPDGSWRTINARGRVFVGENGKPLRFVGTCMDITERKRTEQALVESEAKFSMAFQTSPYAITITRAEDGMFVEVNDTFTSMTGFTREDTLAGSSVGLKLWVHEEDRRSVVADLRAGRAVAGREFLFRMKSGAVITGLFSAQVILLNRDACILSSINDISERKRAEEALVESERKFRALYETMSEGIVYEDHDGKIISANPAAERLLGLSLDQMQGRTSLDPRWKAIHEDGSPFPGETHSLHVAAKTGKAGHDEIQGIYNPKLDAYIWLSINSTPEFLPAEKLPFRAYAVFRDITERKQAEESLARRMEELAQFNAAAVGRELRMVELKEQVNELARQLGQPPPFEMDRPAEATEASPPEGDGGSPGTPDPKPHQT